MSFMLDMLNRTSLWVPCVETRRKFGDRWFSTGDEYHEYHSVYHKYTRLNIKLALTLSQRTHYFIHSMLKTKMYLRLQMTKRWKKKSQWGHDVTLTLQIFYLKTCICAKLLHMDVFKVNVCTQCFAVFCEASHYIIETMCEADVTWRHNQQFSNFHNQWDAGVYENVHFLQETLSTFEMLNDHVSDIDQSWRSRTRLQVIQTGKINCLSLRLKIWVKELPRAESLYWASWNFQSPWIGSAPLVQEQILPFLLPANEVCR